MVLWEQQGSCLSCPNPIHLPAPSHQLNDIAVLYILAVVWFTCTTDLSKGCSGCRGIPWTRTNFLGFRVLYYAVTHSVHQKCTRICQIRSKKNYFWV